MLRFTVLAALTLAVALTLAPTQAVAQEEEPEFNYITTTTIHMPATQDREKAIDWIEQVMVPLAQLNPNVLWYRVATHNWGANSEDVLILAEYDEWANIEGDCPACDTWFDENQPAEDTPEREEWDAMAETFFKFFSGHSDEIYVVNMAHAKN